MELELNLKLESLEERLLEAEAVTEVREEFGIKLTDAQLEYISYYILAKTPRQDRQKYNIMSQAEYDKKNRQKGNVSIYSGGKGSGANTEGIENVIDLIKSESNDYINMNWKVTHEDVMEDSEMGQVLRDYRKIRLHIMKLQRDGKLDVNTYRRLLASVNDDMIMTKKAFRGATEAPVQAKWLGDVIDWDIVDYSNEDHIEGILRTLDLKSDIMPDDTLSLIVLDMRICIDKMLKIELLDATDKKIIDGINSGKTLQELEKEVDIQYSGIRKRFKRICKKIAQYNYKKINFNK